MRLSVRRSLAALAISAALFLAACSEATGPNGEKLVEVADDVFNPMTRTISAGETVMWQWKGSNQHNVTWTETSGTSNSPTQNSGTFTRSFSNTGTFNYFCTIHGTATSGMRGSIVVQ
ncbi:MAG: cupredoxin domain-containing protein [Gemmatimonadetes bacterium]|nr:cupredoxin domain-containing protein [Gemmatimonadota bacterium]